MDFFDSLKPRRQTAPGLQLVEKPCLKEKSPFLQGEYEGETGEAPPAAEKASRFRGSGAIGGPKRGRESQSRDGGQEPAKRLFAQNLYVRRLAPGERI